MSTSKLTNPASNSSTSFAHSDHMGSSFLHVFHVICLVFIFISALLGNSLVIHVIRKDRRLHKPTFYFLVNLSAADIFTAGTYIPFYVISVVEHSWIFGESFCKAHAFLISVGFIASLMTLSLVSLDRYMAIISPLTYPMRITSRRMRQFLVFCWVHAVMWAGFPLVNWGEYVRDPHTYTCRPNWSADGPVNKSYVFCMAFFVFAVPVLLMIYCYARIFGAATNQVKKIAKDSMSQSMASLEISVTAQSTAQPTVPEHRKTCGHELRAHKMILIIIVVFLTCWATYVIAALTRLFLTDPLGSLRFTNTGITLALLSCTVNPLIYAARDRRFKRGFKKIIFKICTRSGVSLINANVRPPTPTNPGD